jgi:hypothetical protein
MKSLTFLVIFTTLTLTNAYSLSFYSGKSCRSQGLGTTDTNVEPGCGRNFAGVGASAVVSAAEGFKDFGKVVVFFNGDDCKPSDIMEEGQAYKFEDGCWTGNYGSYEVWDLWKVDGMEAPALK